MPETASPQRGESRRARTDRRLTEAVVEQLDRHGYRGLTIEAVSATSGVAKTTIYRRWASKAEMIFDLAVHRADQASDVDTGTLAGDVRALAQRAVALVAGEPGRSVLPGLLADMAGDAELTARLRQAFLPSAREDIAAALRRGVARGELESAPEVDDVHAALLGIPYAHVHLLAETGADRRTEGMAEGLTERVTTQLLGLLAARNPS